MAKNNRTCIICGHQYRYCGGCAEYARLPVWMNIYHDENCKKIAEILMGFEGGDYDLGGAKAMLLECDLSVADKLKGSFKTTYEKVFPVEMPEVEEEINTAVEAEVPAENIEQVEDVKEVKEEVAEISPNFKEVGFKKHSKKRG